MICINIDEIMSQVGKPSTIILANGKKQQSPQGAICAIASQKGSQKRD
jgi:hypothetical protein